MSSRASESSNEWKPAFAMDDSLLSSIKGNASDDIKKHLAAVLNLFMGRGTGFADSVGSKIQLTEVWIQQKTDEPERQEAKVVCEITVDEDMLNGGGSIHGGCSAYLVDVCSSLPISALGLITGGSGVGGVSQVINMVYHSPARLGDPLRIINTSLTLGARTMSSRSEIWNLKYHRLVASGVHIKMEPSPSKL